MDRTAKHLALTLVACGALVASCKKQSASPPPPAPAPPAKQRPRAAIPAAPKARAAPTTRPAPSAAAPAARKPPRRKLRVRPQALDARGLAVLSKLRLAKCSEQHLLAKQSFYLRAPETPLNETYLGAFTCGAAAKVRFAWVDGKRVRQVLTDHPANEWSVSSVDAVAFREVNGDGFPDLVAVVSAMTGIGPTGAQDFRVGGFWLGTADGRWRTDRKALSKLEKLKRVTVRSLTRRLRRHYRR